MKLERWIACGMSLCLAASLSLAQAADAPSSAQAKATDGKSMPSKAADSGCEGKAMDKNGKPLAGAAKAAFMKKCEREAKSADVNARCAEKAVGKNGKPLAGAAKSSFMKKCVSEGGPK